MPVAPPILSDGDGGACTTPATAAFAKPTERRPQKDQQSCCRRCGRALGAPWPRCCNAAVRQGTAPNKLRRERGLCTRHEGRSVLLDGVAGRERPSKTRVRLGAQQACMQTASTISTVSTVSADARPPHSIHTVYTRSARVCRHHNPCPAGAHLECSNHGSEPLANHWLPTQQCTLVQRQPGGCGFSWAGGQAAPPAPPI